MRTVFIRVITVILVICLFVLTLCMIMKPNVLNIIAILLNLFLLGSIIYDRLS